MVGASGILLRRGDVIYNDPFVRDQLWSEAMKRDWQGVQVVDFSSVTTVFKVIKCELGKVSVSENATLDTEAFQRLLATGQDWS